MKSIFQGDSRWALLYTWPDGWSVVRSLPLDPNYVVPDGYRGTFSLLLRDAEGSIVSTLNMWSEVEYRSAQSNQSDYPARHPILQIGDASAHTKRWLAFALDMILMGRDDINGRWGVIKLPFWIDAAVWNRMDNPKIEAEIAALAGEGQRTFEGEEALTIAVYRFFRQVFRDHEVRRGGPDRPELVFHVALGPDHTQVISPVHINGQWYLVDKYEHPMGNGETLKEAFANSHFPRQGYFYYQTKEEEWLDSLHWGSPAMDLNLEPYDLLDVSSPVIWPLAHFQAWYDAEEEVI